METLTIVTPPATLPVTLADLKVALRVDHSADDALLVQLAMAATNEAQQATARAFVTQTVSLALDAWPADGAIRLWWPPVQSIGFVKYYDSDGVLQTVAATDYTAILDLTPALVVPAPTKAWPGSTLRAYSPIRVQYVAGYGNASAVDPELTALVIGLVAVDYQNRDALNPQAAAQRERILNALRARWGWAG